MAFSVPWSLGFKQLSDLYSSCLKCLGEAYMKEQEFKPRMKKFREVAFRPPSELPSPVWCCSFSEKRACSIVRVLALISFIHAEEEIKVFQRGSDQEKISTL
ncbi:unnamed protein product [Eretmochelys imbricata]